MTNKWVVCVQTTYDCIKYQTSDGDIKYPRYQDFLILMMQYRVKDPSNFKKQLDSFIPLFIDLDTGDWKKVSIEKRDDISFEELLILNPTEPKVKGTIIDRMREQGKNFINKRKKK